jgi:hypothetical protein
MTDEAWRDITTDPPEQQQRILCKFTVGAPRIVTYNKFCFSLWGITHWKPIPKRTP